MNAEMSTRDAAVQCRLTTQWETVVFKLPAEEMARLGRALIEYSTAALLDGAAGEIADVKAMLAGLPPQMEKAA